MAPEPATVEKMLLSRRPTQSELTSMNCYSRAASKIVNVGDKVRREAVKK